MCTVLRAASLRHHLDLACCACDKGGYLAPNILTFDAGLLTFSQRPVSFVASTHRPISNTSGLGSFLAVAPTASHQTIFLSVAHHFAEKPLQRAILAPCLDHTRDAFNSKISSRTPVATDELSRDPADVTQETFSPSTMLKRGPGKSPVRKTRKRKKNGISRSSLVLDLVDPPTDKPQLMRVWHRNVEDPCTSRQSVVVIPPEPQTGEMSIEGSREEIEATAPASSAAPTRPKRKRRRGNDSVSQRRWFRTLPMVPILTPLNRRVPCTRADDIG